MGAAMAGDVDTTGGLLRAGVAGDDAAGAARDSRAGEFARGTRAGAGGVEPCDLRGHWLRAGGVAREIPAPIGDGDGGGAALRDAASVGDGVVHGACEPREL